MTGNRLGEFLRARRAAADPAHHGLPAGKRRTPGLRREEVAILAGVSTDYYIRLEQGRDKHPSSQVVEALATALGLSADAADHLRTLARPAPPRKRSTRTAYADASLIRLMDGWHTTPALIFDRYLTQLAANPLGEALFDWMGEETNLIASVFLRPAARTFYRDWNVIAENCVAALRAGAGADLDDPALIRLVGGLSLKSADFAHLWSRHDVRSKTAETKRFHHHLVGDIELSYQSLTVNSSPGQQLVVYQAEPGSPSSDALAILGGYRLGTAHAVQERPV
ncbi:Transcriptional regulator, contains XRE-family HTH domain [Sinosporangium album]|uniref:Transcriptional regulator, contains XRE-family HTH domain n=1 Tax=Sinosporangium album TaxID=504805 RepID=A0A1G7ZN10_9ACTN|nr:helix-turn-helix transcriptional regulator [Sinosporangium album]SDH09957.1 Transcriptional regulator, contains XRE-family HTH domain [Sinosporangium album]